ncbi:hypothetical protein LVB87_15560 [Lysobacter sp. KIS68-7]|uniref:RHS repeat-associated core domain-containing protein n=1 Tax=Lysobacter sp. KIS68-7 TaxID=2904252 RepID=UPI001E51A65D|nr:RHS repeat-associated core domain-containing protein [Lysobacter sp. KIS68-7]UHQ19583.1 hypothetical protein LVB87_15560 [Lysobacter sp. KIS68-7]
MGALRNGWRKVTATFLCALGLVTAVPAHARFVSVDPVQADPNSGANFNRYAYASNNPYRYVDPDGRLPVAIPIVIGVGWLLTSGDANAPAPGEATRSMSAGDAAGTFLDAVPAGRATRAISFGVAPVFGNPQVTRSGGKETMHAPTIKRVGDEKADQANASSVHLNQTLRVVTNGEVNSSLRGDVTTRRTDGKIDVTEVLSPRQDPAATIKKYQDALGERAGTITCIQPDKC